MLMAILNGKAGRISLEDGMIQSWRDVFRRREDLLTAVFFGRLRYLSDQGIQRVLALLIGATAAASIGDIKELLFWPKLTVKDWVDRSFVEPDLLILCEFATLLIEVKPPFGGIQSVQQWRNEIESLIRQTEHDDFELNDLTALHFIALGHNAINWRNEAHKLEDHYRNFGLKIHTVEWETLNHAISQLLDTEESRDRMIYSDWLEAFALFGLVDRPLPFADLLKLTGKIQNEWRDLFIAEHLSPEADCMRADWRPLIQFQRNHKMDISRWK